MAVPASARLNVRRPAATSARTYGVTSHSYHPAADTRAVASAPPLVAGCVFQVVDVSDHVMFGTAYTPTGTSPVWMAVPRRRSTARPTSIAVAVNRRNARRRYSAVLHSFTPSSGWVPYF